MQHYKKPFKPYFYFSILLAVIFWTGSNWIQTLPISDFYEKMNFVLSTEGLQHFINGFTLYLFMVQPLTILASMTGFLLGMMAYSYRNDKGIYRPNEEHGSARYATEAEMQKYSDKDKSYNMILSERVSMGLLNERLPRSVQRNKNICVIGDPGSGKTFSFIKPNIMQMNASFFVTDPKGLLVGETGQMLKDDDYQIKIFDLARLTNSDHFNVFNYIHDELDIDRVLEAITEGTKKTEQQGEDFWIQAEALLIRAFIAYLWFDGQDNDYTPNLSMIGEMLRFTKRKDPKVPSPVEEWFEEQNQIRPNNYAYKQWTLFNDLFEAETRASVLAIASGRYSVFDHEQVVDMVKEDTMDIESWIEKKTAVFVIIPETSTAYNFLSAIFVATVAEVLRSKIDKVLTGETKLPDNMKLLPFRFLLDEFANIGRIPNIEKFLSTFRSRNMSIVIVLQALDQLKGMYRNTWASMVTTCASLLFLGGEEEATMKYLSQRAGKQTISIRTHSIGGRSGGSENRQRQGRDLLTPDEISRIGGDECLVFISKENVFKDRKYSLNNHPMADQVANSPQDPNWYRYKRYRNDVEKLFDQTKEPEVIDYGTVEAEAS